MYWTLVGVVGAVFAAVVVLIAGLLWLLFDDLDVPDTGLVHGRPHNQKMREDHR